VDEYLAKLGLDVGGLLGSIDDVLTKIGRLEAAGVKLPKVFDKLDRSAAAAAGTLRGVATAEQQIERESQSVVSLLGRETSAWTKLSDEVAQAEAAYRSAARAKTAGESTVGAKPLQSVGLSGIEQAQAVRDAQNASLTRDANLSQRSGRGYANSSVLSDAEIAETRQNASTFAALLQADLNERQQAEDDATRTVERGVADRARERTAEYTAMVALDAKIAAAEQQAAAAKTSEVGSRSYGNASVLNDAEISRNSQATRTASDQLKEYLQEQARAQQAEENRSRVSLPRLRYAMYDLSTASALLGGALTVGGVAAVKTAVNYEQLYAEVERTSDILSDTNSTQYQKDNQYAALRSDLVTLSTQIPVTFADITKIATAGNQLGVPSQDIADFTEQVAKFSAITNISADDSATAFGRLSQLLHDSDFKGIGDDIAYLGVTSVATESEIVGVAQQLAVTTTQAKFTTDQTLALASTLASLGVKPEQSRGTFIRVFGAISAAVAQPGQKLNDFAAISGKTSEEFAHQWKTDANGAFLSFVKGIGTSGGSAKANLKELGVTAVRDIQTVGLLAQNYDQLTKANVNAASAGGFANKAYQVQAETTASRVTILQNSMQALFDAVGDGVNGPLHAFVDVLNVAANVARALVANPVGAWGIAAAVGLTTIVGALLLVAGGTLRVAANFVAYRQLQEDLGIQTGGLTGIFRTLTAALDQATAATARKAAADQGLAAAQGEVAATAGAEEVAETGDAMDGTTGKTNKLSSALGKAGLVGTALLFVATVPSILDGLREIINQSNGAVPSVDKLTDSFRNLTDASAKGDALKDLKKNLPSTDFLKGDIGLPTPGGGAYTGADALYDKTTTGNTKQLKPGGFLAGPDSIFDSNSLTNNVQRVQDYDKALAKLSGSDAAAAKAGLALIAQRFDEAGLGGKKLNELLPETARALNLTGDSSIAAALKTKELATAQQDTASSNQGYIDDLFATSIASQKVGDDLGSLGKEIYDNGAATALSGSKIATTLSDIYDSSDGASDAAAKVLGFANALEASGLANASQLSSVISYAQQLDPTAKAASFSIDKLVDSFAQQKAKAKEAADGTAENTKQIRTMSDYANDLKGVLDRTTTLRFGDQQGLDAITSSYAKLRDNAKDAGAKIRALKADLKELQTDQSVSKYQLSVAQEYGDVLTASKIRATLEKQNTDITAKKKDISDARSDSSRALTGNSQAAIGNRSSLYGIINQGQSYLTTLAGNGASQGELSAKAGELKKQFIDQATQMGFSKKEVDKLAASFDDMRKVISQVPRNVDVKVKANTNPATAALSEFTAKANATKAKVTVDADKGSADAIADQIAAGIKAHLTNESVINGLLPSQVGTPVGSVGLPFSRKGKRDGGYAGNSPTWAPAGVYHGQEYVLNAQGAQMFPRQMLDAANRGVAPVMPRVTATANVPSDLTVGLRATERQLLAGRGGSGGTVTVDRFGAALDQTYSRADRRN
jgi:TP901 family phage tail tape measure protein